MKLRIDHRTTYRFDAPVFLEPHVVRLRPRSDAAVRLIDFSLDVDPAPAVRAENLDLDGNVVTHAWFEGATDRLALRMRAAVETLTTNPFRFLLAEPDRSLPYAYPPGSQDRLRPYRSPPDAAPDAVRALALDAAQASERDQAAFPLTLAQRLHREFTVEERPEGPPRAPEATAAARRGACRDLAVLFVACCRAMGLAARFASGYADVGARDRDDLHAWGETYLVGGGWRGYDPSHGLAVSDRHVTVAAAADPSDAAPVTGTFRGAAAARLEFEIDVADG